MSDALQPLPWQRDAWDRVTGALAGGRLAHALLLGGPRHLGKRHFAIALAARLLCEAPGAGAGTATASPKPRGDGPGQASFACGTCRSCTLLAAGAHPDATLLTRAGHHCLAASADGTHANAIPLWIPENESKRRDIATDAVRDLIARLPLTSHYGAARVAILDPADALNDNSVNALLKTFEEPPRGTYLVLVAERWQALAPTLRSRCRILRFAPPPQEVAVAWLRARHPQADLAALRAVARQPLAADAELAPEAASRRRDWQRAFAELAAGKPAALKLADKMRREDARELLEWLLGAATQWLRESLGPGPPPLAPAGPLMKLHADAVEGLEALEGNTAPAMVVESIMIRWWRNAAIARAAH
ncbi:MAG TPA: hypothetical protein VM369_03970 [Candidatus Binatia bacterium]|nr:hypothetical protein [Candidatus Binatia bacterium]